MASIKDLKSLDSYDHLIVGGSIAALVAAHSLSKNFKMALLNRGQYVGAEQDSSTLHSELTTLPDNENHLNFLKWTAETCNIEIPFERRAFETLTYSKGEFIPFLGFGSEPPKAIDCFEQYQGKEWLSLQVPSSEIEKQLMDSLPCDVFDFCEVSDWIFEDDQLKSIIINGTKEYPVGSTLLFDYPGQFKEIHHLLPKKLQNQMKPWSETKVFLSHPPTDELPPDIEGKFILIPATKKSEFEPCVGMVKMENDELVSVWRSFCPSDVEEDSEYMGSLVRNIKKTAKKLFSFEEKTSKTKVLVTPFSEGYVPVNGKKHKYPVFGNLALLHSCFSPYSGLFGEIHMGQQAAQDFAPSEDKNLSVSNDLDNPSHTPEAQI